MREDLIHQQQGEEMKRLLIVLFLGLSSVANAADIQTIIEVKAKEHNVNPKFVNAIVKVESGYNPRVRGSRGEYGLGQILCSTARGVGFNGKCDQLIDPETNLEYSVRYLREALNRSDNNECYAATLYSAGFLHKPTRSSYCKKIMAAM